MANTFKVEISENLEQLKKLLNQQSSASGKERVMMLYWLKSGDITTRNGLAQRLNRDPSTIYRWMRKYRQGGIEGLLEVKVAPGTQRQITGVVLNQLQQQLKQREGFDSYGAIQLWLQENFGLEVPYSTVHRTVREVLKGKLKVPRPRSKEADEVKQEEYKKKLPQLIEVMVTHFAQGLSWRYFCTDESRWGLKTLLGRVITARGVKPVVSVQWPRESFWLYGACEPLSGEHFFYRFSHLDGTCFHRFIEQFSLAFPDTLNLLQMDRASAHTCGEIHWPDNVVPVFQPSHSPELNPTERLWQELRKFFKGKNFESLSKLEEAVFEQLNLLTAQKVASLTGYSFIVDAVSI